MLPNWGREGRVEGSEKFPICYFFLLPEGSDRKFGTTRESDTIETIIEIDDY